MYLADPKAFDYRGSGQSLPLEKQYWTPLLRVSMTVNGNPTEARLAVDTSSRHTIVLHRRFVDDNRLRDLHDRTVMVDQPVAKAKQFLTRAGSADLAGLRPGDVIEELDGQPVQGMRLADLQRAFVQDGRDRLLKIRRLGVERTTTLKMLAIR